MQRSSGLTNAMSTLRRRYQTPYRPTACSDDGVQSDVVHYRRNHRLLSARARSGSANWIKVDGRATKVAHCKRVRRLSIVVCSTHSTDLKSLVLGGTRRSGISCWCQRFPLSFQVASRVWRWPNDRSTAADSSLRKSKASRVLLCFSAFEETRHTLF